MLDLPPKNFAPKGLPCVTVDAAILFRISRYGSGEPYFGCSLSNRFDSPSEIPEERFKTCYTALSLEAAFAETVLHDEELIDGNFFIAETALTSRYVIHFAGAPLKIANLTGAALKTLGGNGALSTIKPYDLPQAWSRAIYKHQDQVDGFQYVSRHCNTHLAVVLFERARKKLTKPRYTPLAKYPGLEDIVREFAVQFI